MSPTPLEKFRKNDDFCAKALQILNNMNNCLQYFNKEWSVRNPFNLRPYLESLLKKIEKNFDGVEAVAQRFSVKKEFLKFSKK